MKRLLFLAAVAACMAWSPNSAAAQDDDDRAWRAERFVLELDEDGRVVIDGEAIGESDEPVVIRIEPEDGIIEVNPVERGGRAHVFMRPNNRFAFRSHEGSGPMADFFMDFEPKVRSFMDDFEFDFANQWRVRAEHRRELADLERESHRLARELRNAEGDERRKLESELRSHLEEVFDKKMEIRRERLQRLEEELTKQREQIEARSDARDQMIDDRLRDLLGKDDPLEW